MRRTLILLAAIAGCRSAAGRPATQSVDSGVHWDQTTLRCVANGGGYARLARLKDGNVLLTYERHGRSFACRSVDDGRTFDTPVQAADFPPGSASNPQPFVLTDGTLWLLYNERPRDGRHPFTIRLTVSTDDGHTWTPRPEPLYVAGTKFGDGCWEPAAVQLPSGEIWVVFANEGPYRSSDEQEITRLRTADSGHTWSPPQAVSFRPGFRDGMPVPALLCDGTVAIAIEDNGLTPDHAFKPTIVHIDPPGRQALPVKPGDAHRGGAVDADWTPGVIAGAPYLCAMPDGRTVLSCQSSPANTPLRMTVFVGDTQAKHFAGKTVPFPTDAGRADMWNGLFVKNATTITAVSGTTVNGRYGVWLIDGTLQ